MRGIWTVAIATATLVVGCGGADRPVTKETDATIQSRSPSVVTTPPSVTAPPAKTVTSTPAPAPSEEPRHGRIVTTADSAYGPMLFDRSGQAIYLFARETTSTPECYRTCAAAWPPVIAQGVPQGGGSVRSHLLGTTSRRDGSRQVTYDGHPLYFYVHDGKHEVLCHNVSEFGGLWLVVTPGGDPAA